MNYLSKFRLIHCFILLGITLFTSCTSEPYDIWLCGNMSDGTAAYWVNGEKHTLEAPEGAAIAHDMIVVNDDVYIAGQLCPNDLSKQPCAVYWHNGKIHILTDGTYKSCANAIALTDDGAIFTVGYSYNGPLTRTRVAKFEYSHRRMSVATLWVNDTIQTSLTDGMYDAACEDIIAYGKTWIAVGYDNEYNRFESFVDTYYRKPCVWSNTIVAEKFDKFDNCGAVYTICHNGIDLRLAGYSDDDLESYGAAACYWDEQGWEKILPDSYGVRITNSCTDLSDWYLCGNNDKEQGIYWKNGVSVPLTSNGSGLTSSANAIAALHEDVYVAGTLNGQSGYWRNDEFIAFDAGMYSLNLVGIHIKDKKK